MMNCNQSSLNPQVSMLPQNITVGRAFIISINYAVSTECVTAHLFKCYQNRGQAIQLYCVGMHPSCVDTVRGLELLLLNLYQAYFTTQ